MFLSGSGGWPGWLVRCPVGVSLGTFGEPLDKNTKTIHPEPAPGTFGEPLDKNTKIIHLELALGTFGEPLGKNTKILHPEPAPGVGPTKSLCS